MRTANFLTSSCRHCRYYQSEGRRGGTCRLLGVPVQAGWSSCSLSARPFNAVWEDLETIVDLEHALSLNSAPLSDLDSSVNPVTVKSAVNPPKNVKLTSLAGKSTSQVV